MPTDKKQSRDWAKIEEKFRRIRAVAAKKANIQKVREINGR
jgi:hypothetical protein